MPSLFQARHYQAIAQLLQDATVDAKHKVAAVTVQALIEDFAGMFDRDNGRFKRDLFIAACAPFANVQARTVDGARKGKAARPTPVQQENAPFKSRLSKAAGHSFLDPRDPRAREAARKAISGPKKPRAPSV